MHRLSGGQLNLSLDPLVVAIEQGPARVVYINGSWVKLPKDWISEHASASVGQLA